MKLALADKKAGQLPAPTRHQGSPGQRQDRRQGRTRTRKETITEYFKPYEEPDDAASVIGVTSDGGCAFAPAEPGAQPAPRGAITSGRGGLF